VGSGNAVGLPDRRIYHADESDYADNTDDTNHTDNADYANNTDNTNNTNNTIRTNIRINNIFININSFNINIKYQFVSPVPLCVIQTVLGHLKITLLS
jgi:hypothetical protein